MNDQLQKVAPVTSDELALIRRTVAAGATDDELQLYLYDCARQSVHPLDKLLHFTKRGGKYTPITSIDLMRTRAHDTGECAGIDDAAFEIVGQGPPAAASVTVYRLVQTQRCAFAATARWSEYCPPDGQNHMWKKMPHTMLGKCAEALALRKAFPRQLAGLYAKEEMDQADRPTLTVTSDGIDTDTGEVTDDPLPEAPVGYAYITQVDVVATRNKNIKRATVTFADGRAASTINATRTTLAQQAAQLRQPVRCIITEGKYGPELEDLVTKQADEERDGAANREKPPELSADEIPF